MKNRFLSYIVSSLALCPMTFVSCEKEAEIPEVGTFGKSIAVTLPADKGNTVLTVNSDGQWFASLAPSTKDWASIDGNDSGVGKGTVKLSFQENNGMPRRGILYISSETKATVDTVFLKQYGTEAFFEMSADTLKYTCVASVNETMFDTNIPASNLEKFSFDIVSEPAYDEPWVEPALSADLKKISFAVKDNEDFEPRKAKVTVSFVNEWGDVIEQPIIITQSIPGGTKSTVVKTFEEIRAMIPGAEGELKIEDDIALEGWVISNKESLNMGDCPNKTNHSVDRTPNSTTAFIESKDGSLGFRLFTTSGKTNLMNRYDFTKLWLKGLTLVKEDNPTRYTIKGIAEEHYIKVNTGSADQIPVKTRYINTLKDEDVYTYVTLKRVEMPARRGGLLPVNGGYKDRFTKYPLLFADIHGDWMYVITNLTCFDILPKKQVPFGQGRLSGIIVHEKFERFEKDGNIGRYQIRHCSYSDFAISADVNDSYSKVIVEWTNEIDDKSAPNSHKVARKSPKDIIGEDIPGISWGLRPSDGWGIMYQEPKGTWPAYASNFTDPNKMGTTSATSWGFTPTWDASLGRAHAGTFVFSTKDVKTSMLTFVMTVRQHKSFNVATYFALEASADEGKTWTKVGDFTIPPIADWGNTMPFHLPGDKTIYFVLPQELVGLDRAMLRMYCPNNKKATSTGYDNGTFTDKSGGAFLISYAAVRYKNI